MKKLKGFTLIETTLVLAVAGLIIIMVFVGVPALTATQRDSNRKDQMMLFINKLKSFQANNNRGALPSGSGEVGGNDFSFEGDFEGNTWDDFYGGYLGESFVDPDGERFVLNITTCDAETETSGSSCQDLDDIDFYNVYVVKNATCSGVNAVYSANPRSVAVLYKMERSERFCANT